MIFWDFISCFGFICPHFFVLLLGPVLAFRLVIGSLYGTDWIDLKKKGIRAWSNLAWWWNFFAVPSPVILSKNLNEIHSILSFITKFTDLSLSFLFVFFFFFEWKVYFFKSFLNYRLFSNWKVYYYGFSIDRLMHNWLLSFSPFPFLVCGLQQLMHLHHLYDALFHPIRQLVGFYFNQWFYISIGMA